MLAAKLRRPWRWCPQHFHFTPLFRQLLCRLHSAIAGTVSIPCLTRGLPFYTLFIPNKTGVQRDLILWHVEGDVPQNQDKKFMHWWGESIYSIYVCVWVGGGGVRFFLFVFWYAAYIMKSNQFGSCEMWTLAVISTLMVQNQIDFNQLPL